MSWDAAHAVEGQWKEGEQWRVVEQKTEGSGWIKLKFIFRDGTSAYRNFRPGTFTPENVLLSGDSLLANPEQRQRR